MEQTFMMLKPDAIQRGLVGPILGRFESRGLRLCAVKLLRLTADLAARHYAEHKGKGFYDGLLAYITSGPVLATVLEGPEAIAAVRKTLGATRPLDAAPGTIRGDFGITVGRNLVHASASPDDARREIALFFAPTELVAYERTLDPWILE